MTVVPAPTRHAPGSTRPRSPSALVSFTACVHRTELERAREAGLVQKPHYPNPALDALVERGRQHELAFLEQLRAEGLGIVEIPTAELKTRAQLEEAAAATQAAMQAGVQVIYQATFFDGMWRGHADFLRRRETPSVLGDWSYEPWDTKLAREVRASALMQLCAYADMVEDIQGTPPEFVHVVLGGPGRPVESYRIASVAPYFRRVRDQFNQHLASAGPPAFPVLDPYPDPVEHCEICDWSPVCEKRWRDEDYIALVAGITRKQRKALKERGITTLTALSHLPLAQNEFTRVREQARVQREGREQDKPISELILPVEPRMGLEALPAPSHGDVFFDIEGDPFVGDTGREYLFGLYLAAEDEYRDLWAFDAAAERAQFEAVIDLLTVRRAANPAMHVYHYAPYEPSALKRLAARLATRVEEVDALLRANVFVDLYRVVRQGIRASVESYSIKKLERFYGFARVEELQSAGDARAVLDLWLESGAAERLPGHDEICEKVRRYNRDDCVSALELRNWLEERRIELAERLGKEVPRPAPQDPEPETPASAARAELDALAQRITAGIPLEGRTEQQQAQWLVAQLLEWHAREDKSAWWEYFRLSELSDDELVEERTPIGKIEYVGPVGTVKKSTLHRYRFPPQEYDIEAGDQCREPRQDQAVKIESLDEDACTFDVKRQSTDPAPEIRALVPLGVLGTKAQRARLKEIGEYVAAHGIAHGGGQHRLAGDLLLRVPAAAAPLLRPGETAAAAAVRLVLDLARSPRGGVLPIQGPPGAGKTYTGAKMILALIAAGFRVGVTAQSHKVICNLLKKTCELAHNTLAIAQKGNEDEVLHHPMVTRCSDNEELCAMLNARTAYIGAGTSWLWAHDAAQNTIDVLFVDEAAQMSLANVVAVTHAARVLVLLGDPMQLDQPRKGVHPPGAEVSAMEHLLGKAATMPPDRGLFLDSTWRLNPTLCRFTSDTFYEGRLAAEPGREKQQLLCGDPLGGAGLRFWPVDHSGNQNESEEEVTAATDIYARLLAGRWIDAKGVDKPMTVQDILVVAPYNAQVKALLAALPQGARVGTVDKFQGQEAPVVIYSMATSTPEDAPRGMEFLYSLNRLNVATSRAQCVAIIVASPALLLPACKTPRQMMQASGLCAAVSASCA